jgi:hypothetical protein
MGKITFVNRLNDRVAVFVRFSTHGHRTFDIFGGKTFELDSVLEGEKVGWGWVLFDEGAPPQNPRCVAEEGETVVIDSGEKATKCRL